MFAEESMDVDPNYDPSDFLMAGLPRAKIEDVKQEGFITPEPEVKIHDDLAVSESDDEGLLPIEQQTANQHQLNEEDDGGDLWF